MSLAFRPSFNLFILRSAVSFAALASLCGCDLALAGYLTPGIGRPMTGRVLDARTQLPVGGATVLAGLGSTTTDAQGYFRLFGNFASREVSVSRAGYMAVTQGGLSIDPGQDLIFSLDPLFPATVPLTKRFLELSGAFGGLQTPTTPAMVALAGTAAGVNNGAYSVRFEGEVPGRILTAVLAWGTLSAPYIEGAQAAQPFYFNDFAYQLSSWPLGNTVPEGRISLPLSVSAQVPIQPVKVAYSNLGSFATVQTDVALDFGVAGYVPVARALSSSQSLPVPTVAGLKYVVTGEARDATGKTSSLVTLTTNNPGQAAFQLLSVPKVLGPAPGQKGAGQRPTFSWNPVPGDVNYEVILLEEGEAKPKWIGTTDQPEITYPSFAIDDINGGALRPDKTYSWTLRAVELLDETETPTAARPRNLLGFDVSAGPIPIKPYRVRKREAMVADNRFGL